MSKANTSETMDMLREQQKEFEKMEGKYSSKKQEIYKSIETAMSTVKEQKKK